MHLIKTTILVAVVCFALSDAFIFKKKNSTEKAAKSACDKSPCKNKAPCKLDSNKEALCECSAGHHGQFCQFKTKTSVCDPNPCNKGECKVQGTQAVCTCPNVFHGKWCHKETGCSKKPCRKGTCQNDPKNLSNFICKCNGTYIGENCDKSDPCNPNPCKLNSTCTRDADLKGYTCGCPPGLTGKQCHKTNCTIVQFKGKNFDKSGNKLYVDQAALKKFEDLDGLAQLCKVHIHAIRGFLHNPNARSNKLDTLDKTNPHHYIGQALQFEIYDTNDKLLCNDICLGKIPIPVSQAKCFIDGLNAIKWKWSILDPTTVHTGFATANTNAYNHLREHHQVGCREMKN